MNIGYVRVSTKNQNLDLQTDALVSAGVSTDAIYADTASGKIKERPQLQECLKALRSGDTLIVWKLDRLGRSLIDLVNIVNDLAEREINFKVLTGQGADIDTTTPAGRLIFGVFASLAEYERELIAERVKVGLDSARARGRVGGRKPALMPNQMKYAQKVMQEKGVISELCAELGISTMTLYRYFAPNGDLRDYGKKILSNMRKKR